MTLLDTLNYVKQDEYHLNVSQALVYKLLSRFREGTAAAELMGRPPLRNTGKGTEVELVVSNDRRQMVRYLAEITATVHMILNQT